MKKLFTYLAVISMTLSVFAQSPQKMSYQCVVRNASGVLVINQGVGIRISILQGTTTGIVVFQETYNPNPQTNANGLISLEIGSGLVISGTFSAINWAAGPYFLKTETDPTGGTNYTIIGTSQLLSVPYALYAKSAGNGFSGDYYDLTNKPILFGGNYNDLTNKPSLFNGTWADITDKPITLLGYGITDAMNTSHIANGITSTLIGNWNTAFGWGNHAGLYRPNGYVPAWSEIKSKPTTISGFGITDAVGTTGDQTIAGNKVFSGTITGTINANNMLVSNVAKPVNTTDAANKAYVDNLKKQIKALEDNLIATGTFKLFDVEGNQYKVVKIGTQVWMAENLKTTKFSNGEDISTSVYDNDENNAAIYGRLYGWPAIPFNRNVCPAGWHVPSDSEWITLFASLGGEDVAGGKLKETGTMHWNSPNTGATNESLFTALPGGYRLKEEGEFTGIGNFGYWWSRTPGEGPFYAQSGAWDLRLYYDQSKVKLDFEWKGSKLSVRCIRDIGPTLTTDSLSNITIAPYNDQVGYIATAISGGHVENDNGSTITHKGICWNDYGNPEINDSHTDEGGGSENFKSTLSFSGFRGGNSFYVYIRAYATNGDGTGYGNEIYCVFNGNDLK